MFFTNKKRNVVIVGVGVFLSSIILFQNCSPGFQIDPESNASLAQSIIEPSIDIKTADGQIHSTSSFAIDASMNVDRRASVQSLKCSLNGAPETDCPSPLTFSSLSDGQYAVAIRLTDSRGAEAVKQLKWTIDTTAPTADLTAAPGTISGPSASFVFVGADVLSGVAKLECAFDTPTFTTCVSPIARAGLTAGRHTFRVRAIDKAGNVGISAERSWTVDLSAPDLRITSAPPTFTNSRAARIDFSASAPGVTITRFECSIDSIAGGAFAACSNPKEFASLNEGRHVFQVRAFNESNGTTSTATSSWTVDITPPSAPVIVTATPIATSARTATFMFSAVDSLSGIASYQCTLDGQAVACTSPYTTNQLVGGVHSFSVQAVDSVGNRSTPANFNWTIEERFKQISSGSSRHTCGITLQDTVKCWGTDGFGNDLSNVPVDVPGLSGIRQITVGNMHACAITAQGGVKCWGNSGNGQLGNEAPLANARVLVDVLGLTGIKQVATGYFHTCAITAQDTVKCWGANFGGPLGNGTSVASFVPVDVLNLTGVTSLSAGASHTCAVAAGGVVKCWGDNLYRQFGDGTTNGSLVPIETGLTGIKQISGIGTTTCVVTALDTAKCWGVGFDGQLGNGSTGIVFSPVDVQGLAGIKRIYTGSEHVCAITAQDSVKCWGKNNFGQVDGGFTNSPVPTDAPMGLNGISVVGVAIGSQHTCVLSALGIAKCWGRNIRGQLGNASNVDSLVPVDVRGRTRVM